MSSRTYELPMSSGDVPVTVTERGQGDPVLLLHGGAGPDSVTGFADLLAERFPYRVLTPVHPGFNGTERPDWLDSIGKLAEVYERLLVELDLTGVTVAGSSIGGWIAAELALAAGDRVARLVLIDAAGLDSAEHPIVDFYSLTLDQVADLSWANPEGHRIDLSAMTDAQRAIMAGNRAALQAYGGQSMADPPWLGGWRESLLRRSSSGARLTGSSPPPTARSTQPPSRRPPSSSCPAPGTCRSWRLPRPCSQCSRTPASGRTRWRGTRGLP
jgi:pimeloyl-ACP methyl ester carboxylesterase